MSKHKYEVSGITVLEGYRFSGKCVASDIIKAIQLFYENGYFVWKIEKKEQVNCDEEIGIKSINMLGMYSATGKSHLNDNLYMNGELCYTVETCFKEEIVEQLSNDDLLNELKKRMVVE